ncbi:MAG: hypothetical protein CM15mP74_30660 [Halieaceae bacterium]|nr:MAG: hypothetical protein CM15mP74_30660 [Halieaceae bacterium]
MQQQWRLAARPEGIPDRSHFDLIEVPIPTLEPGKAVVKTLYLGVAPVMLRYMRNETDFESPLALGSIMAGRGVAQVIESDCSDLPVGAVVQARLGWQEYALIDMSHQPAPFFLPTDLPLSHGIGAVSLSGITALVGIRDIGKVKPDDRILVSGLRGSRQPCRSDRQGTRRGGCCRRGRRRGEVSPAQIRDGLRSCDRLQK